jgi:indolepyruvate decarboxylase
MTKIDCLTLAKAFGAKGYREQTVSELNAVLKELKRPTKQPSLVEVVIPEKDLPGQMRRLGLE